MTVQSIGFAVLWVVSIVLFVMTVRVLRRGRAVKVADSALLLLVIGGLVYDNFMLSFGGILFDESTAFELSSYPRYVMHALFTPLLIMFCALSAERLSLPGYEDRGRLTLWGAVTFFAILAGVAGELQLTLRYALDDGVYAYKAAGEAGAPLAEIATVVSMLIIGGAMQRYARWPWVLLSAATMFVFALFFLENGLLQNIGEILLLSSCVATAYLSVGRVTLDKERRRREALERKRTRVGASEVVDTA
jgi:hypothetical protein